MRTLAVVNQKGGVGKSTLTVHLAYAAHEAGLRVLVVDLDRQGSLSMSFPAEAGAAQAGLTASALFSTQAPAQGPETLKPRLSIIRADDTLAQLSAGVAGAEKRPAHQLQRWASDFDLCLIDTPGAIGFNPPMTFAALVAADAVVCPFSVGLYEAKGLADLWEFLRSIKTPAYNPRLMLLGLIPSKLNTKSPQERHAMDELRRSELGKRIMPHTLAERASVKQAISLRRPVWRRTKGAGHLAAAKEWRAACDYILGQLEKVKK